MLRTNRKLVFLMQMRDSRGPFILSILPTQCMKLGHYVEDKSYISFFFMQMRDGRDPLQIIHIGNKVMLLVLAKTNTGYPSR